MTSDEDSLNLPAGWALATVGDLADYINGMAFKPSDWKRDGRPIIRIQNLTDPSKPFNYTNRDCADKFLVRAGDILVSWSASLDAFVWHGPEAVLNQHIFKVVPSRHIGDRYLFHQLRSVIQELIKSEHLHGSTMLHINRRPFLAHSIRLPPRREQDRIAEKIDELFSRVEAGEQALTKVQTLLKTYRQSVLKAAVTGELTNDWRAKNGEKGETGHDLLKRILKARRDAWEMQELAKMKAKGKTPKDDEWKKKYREPTPPDVSNLPELPDGWTWATFPMLGEFGRGKSKHRPRNDPKLFGGPFPFIQTGVVTSSNGIITTFEQTYSAEGLRQSRLWPAGTICITIAANIAHSGIMEFDGCFPDSVVGLIPDANLVGRYVEFFIRTARENLEKYAPATAQKNINLEILESVAVPLPSDREQREIVAIAEALFLSAEKFEQTAEMSLSRSHSLRQSILRSAFSGQLVAQDPSDEPASVLLERIAAERSAPDSGPKQGRKPRTATASDLKAAS